MCGRFTLTSNLDDLQGRFGFLPGHLDFRPRYNVAPTQQVLAVVNDGQRRAELLRWGLIPFWAKDPKIGYRMINAVGETVATKPAFRAAFRKRRCLVLADGFFEWRKEGKEKLPMYIFLKSRAPFAFAGIWETWKALDGETVRSCAIVTTKPNAFMEPIHNRMPVILSEETEALWLDPMTEEAGVLEPLLVSYPPELMDSYPVSGLVNSPKNHGPECIQQLSPS
jgi:putative SOS response-associated peptidase YedK